MPKYQISVKVRPEYLPDRSNPEANEYVFAYHVTITNTGQIAAQVIARTWNINHASGLHEKVKGLAVVGHQPLLQPGEVFEYSSGCVLTTPTGMMHGSYFCMAEDCEKFEATIPVFVLDALSPSGRTLH